MNKRQAIKIIKRFERDCYYKNMFTLNKAYDRMGLRRAAGATKRQVFSSGPLGDNWGFYVTPWEEMK